MATDKPLISVLMAVYEPRMDWLKEQLDSLNAQTYPNLRLYVRDDCSPTTPFEKIETLVQECVTAFPYSIARNAQNLGSNGTFELLTREAEGEYFAYCDQDDIWLPEKLAVLQDTAGPATMIYSDMSVIDERGETVAETLRMIRPRLQYVSGTGLAETFFFRNCTAGCSMLVHGDIAKAAIPFPKQTVCDQWIAIAAAQNGSIAFIDSPLMQYRQHMRNQTGILVGVTDKASYRRVRLEPLRERLEYYERVFGSNARLSAFVHARLENNISGIWRNRKLSPIEAKFEIAMHFMPEAGFRRIVRKLS